MNFSARQLTLCSVAATGLLMLSACGKNSSSDQSPASSSTAASTPAAPTQPATAPTPSTAPASAAPASTAPATPAPTSTAAPAPASTTGAVSTPAAAGGFAVSNVVVGDTVASNHKVSKAATVIAPNKSSIYASVETTGRTPGATLSARWSYIEGNGQLVSAISQSISTNGPAVTTFRIQNPHAWPEGKYKVDISLDGKPVSSKVFEVRASA